MAPAPREPRQALLSPHTWALAVIALTLVLDGLAAVAYAHLAHIPILPPQRGPYDGLDWATATLMTTGDSGPPPLTRSQHWLWLGVHYSIIPLGAASISLFTSALTATHVHRAEGRIKQHVEARLTHHLNREDSNGQLGTARRGPRHPRQRPGRGR